MKPAQAPKPHQTYFLLIGAYTHTGKSKGIYVYEFDSRTGNFNYKSSALGIENPSYLTISANRTRVYAVNENNQGNGGLSAFSFNSLTGELTFLNQQNSMGDDPCYLSTDQQGKYVFVANYSGGSLSVFGIEPDGALSNALETIHYSGHSIHKIRQEKPHIHAAVLSPDSHFLLVTDLGTDQIYCYQIDETSQKPLFKPPAVTPVKPGSGPRHLCFHPNGKYVYLIQEISGEISVFNYLNGKLSILQSLSMLNPDFNGDAGAADIHISPDGRFLYASIRGNSNEILIYSINSNGELQYVARQAALGKTPRNFAIDPEGNYLLVANQNSHEIVIFKRDQQSGLLSPTGKTIKADSPVCLLFVKK
ncbi:MAG TPA: lactonase family protein [Daejeonella sp.]|nr:lactonase family protein [Daejeonella sp.]